MYVYYKMFHVKHLFTNILTSLLEKIWKVRQKVTWQQRVCRAIIVSSKGEAWHMEPAEGAAAKPTLCPYISEYGNRYDREEKNGYSD